MERVHPLRVHRLARGWSLEEVAARLVSLGLQEGARGLAASATSVGRWERGQCQPRHPYPALLCILFEATPVELGLAPSPYLLPSGKLEGVERRAVLRLVKLGLAVPVLGLQKAAGAVGGRGPEPGEDADRVAHALSRPSAADETTVAAIESAIAAARRLDDVWGARVAVRPALAQREIISTLLAGGPSPALAWRLTVAAGNLSQFLAHLAHEMNDDATARRYLEESLRIAHETDTHNLGAYVLGWRSRLDTAEEQPRQALAFAETARIWAETKGSPATQSLLAGYEADALAKLGDRRGAERALDGARRALARSKAEDEPPWMYYYQESSLDYRFGSVYLTLGLAGPARQAVKEGIATRDPSKVRDRAYSLVSLGRTYVLDSEVDETCRLGGQALTIATATGCDRAVVRVRELRAQLKPWESQPAVRDLDDQLAATSAWCPPVSI